MVKKNLTQEDKDLFRQSIGQVKTLDSNKVLLNQKDKPKPYPKPTKTDLDDSLFNDTTTDLEKVGLEDSLSYTAPGLQNNVLKKLRKGHFGLDADIDLHGLTSNAAKNQLLVFLNNCIASNYRCVHIVHGKGYRSADSQPVLKNDLNLWLRQHKNVQAFCSAPQSAGGTGALYILLKVNNLS